jgi:hypothetical protein
MATDISKEGPDSRQFASGVRAQSLTRAGRNLAQLLWSIERFGDIHHQDKPAPLHSDLAWQLQTSRENTDALHTAILAMIKEQSDG